MAQLTDDCFAFGGPMLTVDQAAEIIHARISPVEGVEEVALGDADGRVLARDVASPLDLPPFDNSAVDGYAVRHADLSADGDTRLPVRGRLIAGDSARAPLAPQTAMRIFTGAPMPPGADTVFMQEDVREEEDVVVLPKGLKRGANARDAGEDIRRGARLLPAGRMLRPQDLSLAAAVGLASLPVRRRVRVAIFSTGNEIANDAARDHDDFGSDRSKIMNVIDSQSLERESREKPVSTFSHPALLPGAIHDANRPLLIAMLKRFGADVSDLGVLRDAARPLADALSRAAETHDLILTTGGVSTGEEDHVKAAVEEAGSLTFWRIGIKPGRPVALGVVKGAAFAGLPGNPVAVFVTFAFVVRPILAQLAGAVLPPLYPVIARAGFAYKKKKDRREYVRVVVRYGEGAWVAKKFVQDGAGVITSLTETDGLAELAEDVTAIAPGDEIRVYPYAQLL